MTRLITVLLIVPVLILSGACGPAPAGSAPSGAKRLSVVATTGMIADVAASIGGERVGVQALMGEGVDPHLYKANPGDVRATAEADLILYSGLHLEGRMADVIVKMAARQTVVQVTETIPEKMLLEPPEFGGHPDPHVWFDVSLWRIAAERVRDAIAAKDPAGKAAYEGAAADYLSTLDALHEYAKTTLATVPKDRRMLVTAHDAFGYFGRAYGLEVRGIQGISTDSEASLRDINALVDLLVAHKVPSVFVETSVPRKTIDALVAGAAARGHVVNIGGELFSDAMGAPGTLGGTYVGMVLHNVESITRALGGVVPSQRPERIAKYLQSRGVR